MEIFIGVRGALIQILAFLKQCKVLLIIFVTYLAQRVAWFFEEIIYWNKFMFKITFQFLIRNYESTTYIFLEMISLLQFVCLLEAMFVI